MRLDGSRKEGETVPDNKNRDNPEFSLNTHLKMGSPSTVEEELVDLTSKIMKCADSLKSSFGKWLLADFFIWKGSF